MNIILLEPAEIVDNQVRLVGRQADHIVKVLRSQPGDQVKIGIINGKIGHGTIKNIHRHAPRMVTLVVDAHTDPPPAPLIDIALGLPRPIMLKRILSQLAALGIGRLYLVNATRVEKSFWDASLLAGSQLREHLLAGLEQAVDTRVPEVFVQRGFKPFIEQELPRCRGAYRQLLVAHPGAEQSLESVWRPRTGRDLLAIGPEGGWTDYEVGCLIDNGFRSFSLGPRILRVETAVVVLHALLAHHDRLARLHR